MYRVNTVGSLIETLTKEYPKADPFDICLLVLEKTKRLLVIASDVRACQRYLKRKGKML
jgi:hypothetical protein